MPTWASIFQLFKNNLIIDFEPFIQDTFFRVFLIDVTITWEDGDPDSNADIALYYDTNSTGEDGILIVDGLKEDPDGESDAYPWDITEMADGSYYVYAATADETASETSYGLGTITIDKTLPIVSATPAGGSYDMPQNVTLAVDEAAVIYYTMDGTEPTKDAPVYNSPIDITDTTTLKFMAVDVAGNQGETITETYTIASEGVPVNISGGAYNFPVHPRYRAVFSMDVSGPSAPSGWLKYYYSQTRMNFVSTEIIEVSDSDNTYVISGTGSLNGIEGYTFTAQVTDGTPDGFGITVNNPDYQMSITLSGSRQLSCPVFLYQ